MLVGHADELIEENKKDIENAKKNNMPAGLLDRLTLTKERIQGMAEGLIEVQRLEDPVGAVEEMRKRPNGLLIGRMTVPLGVVGVIYEARPNVTSDVSRARSKQECRDP